MERKTLMKKKMLMRILALCSMLLFFFDVEFLASMFIIIYVGAIAVLFLFTIMMLISMLKKN